MKKRIVICADGTWNRPEKDLEKDHATNVLKLARAIKPVGEDNIPQQVFYDWGIGSYYDKVIGGATGRGINKNIMDNYRYIVQNYAPGDELFFFGFSRGAYTVRSLCGLINNCGILKRPDARLIQAAFDHYKHPGGAYAPDGNRTKQFKKDHSHPACKIAFLGVWDTVGALGIPRSLMGLLDSNDEFYDTAMSSAITVARHALSIDEHRQDFEPTILEQHDEVNLKQVWFSGVHSDVGGGYAPGKDGVLASDAPLEWMMSEATKTASLSFEPYLRTALKPSSVAGLHKTRRHIYRFAKPLYRPIKIEDIETLIHKSVKERWDKDSNYRPKNLVDCLQANGDKWPELVP